MRRLLLRGLVLAAAAAAPAAAAARAQVPAEGSGAPPLELLHGFTLIDGRGGPPIEDGAIAVRGEWIVAAGPRARLQAALPEGEEPIAVDLGGGWVVPGLIDAHVHLATAPDRAAAERELERLLRSGITTVRDMAGDARVLAALARDALTGAIVGPDIHYAALVAGPSFFEDHRARLAAAGVVPGRAPWMQAIDDRTDPVVAVALARGTSASGLKIYADLPADLVRRLAAEAHRQGLPVWAHATVHPARPLEVVRAGVDVVSHVCSLAWEAMSEVPPRYHQPDVPEYARFRPDAAVFDELLREMARRGTILDATLAWYARPGTSTCGDHAPELVRRAHEAGVPVAAGTDFTTPAEEAPALFLELEALVERAGFTPLEAIGAATRVAAAAAGVDEVVGTLEPGRRVDFVLLDADPAADIRNLRHVREVWKRADRHRIGDRPPRRRGTTDRSSR